MAGTGWTCTLPTCGRSDILAAGSAYPAIVVTVNVAGNAPARVTNQVSVSGGGAASIANSSDPTNIILNYLVGDVFPYTSDTAPNFGDGNLNILDLVQVLFCVDRSEE